MMHRSELAPALRYRWKVLLATFLLGTGISSWLLTERAVHASAAVGERVAPAASLSLTRPTSPAPLAAIIGPGDVAATHERTSPGARPSRPANGFRNGAEISRLQKALWSALDRKDALTARLAALSLPATPPVQVVPQPVAVVNPEVRAATAQVAAARTNLAELRTRYTDAHPDVAKAMDELGEAERRLGAVRRANPPAAPIERVAPRPAEDPETAAERTASREELASLEESIPGLQSQLDAAMVEAHRPSNATARQQPEPYWPLVLPHTGAAEPIRDTTPAQPVTFEPQQAQDTGVRRVLRRSVDFLLPGALAGLLLTLAVFALLESLDTTVKGPTSLRHALPHMTRQVSCGTMRP